jgi:L-amino acid N-acyltransferase YncA
VSRRHPRRWPNASQRRRTRTHGSCTKTNGRVVGYAYGGPHQERAAYRFSCEVSVYVEQGRLRTGSGRALYEALFKRLAARGYLMAVAGMTLPNEASAGLHRAMGFEPVGVYRRIGWKFLTRNLLHLARMLKDAGGFPAHGNQRSAWDAGCQLDFANPDYR